MGVQQPSLQFRQRGWRGHKQVWVLECCPCMRSHSCQRKAASSTTAAIRELVRLKLALHLKMECVGVFLHALVWRGSTIQDKGIISNRDGGQVPLIFKSLLLCLCPLLKLQFCLLSQISLNTVTIIKRSSEFMKMLTHSSESLLVITDNKPLWAAASGFFLFQNELSCTWMLSQLLGGDCWLYAQGRYAMLNLYLEMRCSLLVFVYFYKASLIQGVMWI